jgi:hypothetical protein
VDATGVPQLRIVHPELLDHVMVEQVVDEGVGVPVYPDAQLTVRTSPLFDEPVP